MGQRLDALNKGLGLIWDTSKSKFDPIYFSNCEGDKDFQGTLRGKYNMLTSMKNGPLVVLAPEKVVECKTKQVRSLKSRE